MYEQVEGGVRPPQYLDEVEKAIGVRFFALPHEQALARANPGALLELEGAPSPHAGIYFAGLKLLLEARKRFNLSRNEPFNLTNEQWTELRREFREEREALIGKLQTHAQVVEEELEGLIPPTTLRRELDVGRVMFADLNDEAVSVMTTFKRTNKSGRGPLYFEPVEADRVREVSAALVYADPDDVQARELISELRTSNAGLKEAAEVVGITIDSKRIPAGRLARYISATGAAALREHFAALEDNSNWRSVGDIADAAGVDMSEVRAQATWNGYDEQYSRRRRLNDEGKMIVQDYLPEECAERIIQELAIVIPDEYMTISDFASLHGIDPERIRRAISKHELPLHEYTIRDRTFTYLDGATIYRLKKLENLKPYEQAPEGWKTMREILDMVEASDVSIARRVKDVPGAMRTMRPREGEDQRAVPHYSPQFVEHVRRVIPPKGVTKGRTPLSEVLASTGLTNRGLVEFLRREGLEHKEERDDTGHPIHTYDNEELTEALKKLPKRWVPISGISLDELAAFNGTNKNNMRQKLLRAKKRLPEGEFTAGKYFTEAGGVGVYYLKEELRIAGIKVPITPAFPAGERPYGSYGPARARGNLPSQEQPVPTRAPSYRPGITVRPPKPTPGGFYTRPNGPLYPAARPVELEPKSNKRQPRHLPEEPGSWSPRAVMTSENFVSVTERLSRAQLAERLNVHESDIEAALERIDPGEYKPEGVMVEGQAVVAYSGRLLLAVREQLVGVATGYVQMLYGLTDIEMGRARIFLRRRHYLPFNDNRYSPSVVEIVGQNLALFKEIDASDDSEG